jgi:hypothetical protein
MLSDIGMVHLKNSPRRVNRKRGRIMGVRLQKTETSYTDVELDDGSIDDVDISGSHISINVTFNAEDLDWDIQDDETEVIEA